MKNALILHGAGNDPKGNWFPWLKSKLEVKGWQVWAPDLPNTDRPIQKDWLGKIFSNKHWGFTGGSIMIGHSAGATLILRILERLPKETQIHKVILVAGTIERGTKPEYFQYKEDLVKRPFNWKKIKQSCEKFYFIHSKNDPYECGSDQGEIMHRMLGGELIIQEDQGHFNLERSPKYKQFPLILSLLEEQ